MSWIKDIISPQTRQWEEFYRNRFQHDRIVRSTHGVNCTGGCSWQIHVKDGIVVWETQQLDYPLLEDSLPPYEPRGCQRGISFSWYLYSPLRIKYPLIRGALIDAYREEKAKAGGDPFEAWTNLQNDEEKRKKYQNARGKGGFRRVHWDEVLELMAVANLYTAKKYGPDRVIGFSPIPAMSMLSYAAGGPVPAALRRREPQLLRLVLRPADGLPRDLGRADRRLRERRLVQREDDRGHGRMPEHDPHARLSLSSPNRDTTEPRPSSSHRISARSASTPTSGCRCTPEATARSGWPRRT